MIHGGDDSTVKIFGVHQTGIHSAGQAFGSIFATDLLHSLQRRKGMVAGQIYRLPQFHCQHFYLRELLCVPGLGHLNGLVKTPQKIGAAKYTGDHIGKHHAGKEGFRVTVGQGNQLTCQFARSLRGNSAGLVQHTGGNTGGDGAGGVVHIFPLGHTAVELQTVVIQHPDIPAMAAVELGQLAQEARARFRIPAELLGAHPFFQRHFTPAHIFLFASGQSQQQAVTQEGGNLGVGSYGRVFIFLQIKSQKAIGAVFGLDFFPGFIFHSISHGIAHSQAKQTAAVISGIHSATSFYSIYTL